MTVKVILDILMKDRLYNIGGNGVMKEKKTKQLPRKQQLCIKCRKCCEKVGVYTDPYIYEMGEQDVIDFYKSRGATVTKSDGELFIVFDLPCPHLTEKGCNIYPKRPKICRIYSGKHEFGDECLWSTLSTDKRKKTGKSAKT
jgi:Fe-S-cluster containining protein